MRKLILLTTLLATGLTGLALAATAQITATVSPNRPKAGSSIQVTATGFTSTTLPTALTVDLQKGFSTSVDGQGVADSTKALCTSSQESNNTCPQASQIDQGTATVLVSSAVPGTSDTVPVTLTLFAGRGPAASGCPATVDIVFTSTGLPTEHEVGDLCKHAGGLELSFTNLPNYSSEVPAGFTATVQKLYVAIGASTTVTTKVKKKVKRHGKSVGETVKKTVKAYALNNPGTCPSSGQWTGTLTVGFGSSGSTVQPFTIACTK